MAAGETVCPRGHRLPVKFSSETDGNGEATTVDVDLSRLVDTVGAPRLPSSRPSSIFECEQCERLVEMQEHEGRVIVPSFCPWCGKPVTPIIGREIDGYEVVELLAQGGFGLVYLASNVAEPKMKAVIKFLRPRMGYLQPNLISVFVEEARLTEEIGQTCWNVVRVSNVRERPWPYFFMEYIRGTTLDHVLRSAKEKRIPIEDAKGYLRGIAKALAATHAHGRVHRDLKPLNIMVIQSQDIRAEERVKLLDFGLSMKIARGRTSFEGATSEMDDGAVRGHSPVQSAGTPEYMPPEAFDGLNEFSGDLYSFGVTAYEILTGETPWTQPPSGSERFFYWRDTHKKAPPRPIREVRPDVPAWLAGVIMKCLEKDPNQRIRTADELISRLREPLPRWLWAAAGAAVLLFGVLLWFALRGGGVDGKPALWSGPGETMGSEHRVWVRRLEDLSGLVEPITLRASDGSPILECKPSSPLVDCKVTDGSIEVTFPGGTGLASLIGSGVTIEGRGDGFRVEGKLDVGLDETSPKFVDMEFGQKVGILEASASIRRLPDVLRLQPTVMLVVSVKEENIGEVVLNFFTLQDTPYLERIEGKRVEGEDTWRFSLANLKSGEYTAGFEAADRAGNKDFIANFTFIVDSEVDLTLISKDGPKYTAGGRALYEIDRVEALARVKVQDRAGRGKAWTLHDARALTALEVARGAEAPTVVEPTALDSLKGYLVAVSVKGDDEGPFDLVVTDTATPPNEATWKLHFKAPDPLGERDVTSIALEFEDETANLLYQAQEDFKLSTSARSTRVKGLRADFSRSDRILGMAVTLNRVPVNAEVNIYERSATLDGFELPGSREVASTENELLLTFRDPLDRTLSIPLSIRTDLVSPKIDIHAQAGGRVLPRDLRVDDWKKVELWIESEPLSKAECHIQGQILNPIELASGGTKASFDVSSLVYSEKSHPFKVRAFDLAGNSDAADGVIVLNQGPPRVRPTGLSAGVINLTGKDFSFEVIDGNERSYGGAVVEFDVGGNKKKVAITPPAKQTNIHSVSLPPLTDGSEGTLTIRIADEFELWSHLPHPGHTATIWPFKFRRLRTEWPPVVRGWQGMDWVYIQTADEKEEYYISRTEVPIRVHAQFVAQKIVKPPKHWGKAGEPPAFYTKDGKPIDDADLLPVVGVEPEDAEKVAQLMGGSLPKAEKQWLHAAWKENRGKYPWRDSEAARDYANCHTAWERRGSPFYENRQSGRMNSDDVFWAVRVDFDPWVKCPASVKEELKYPGKFPILHLIGNVGELVHMEDGSYSIAGGDFLDRYEDINLLRQGGIMRKYEEPDARTGFRVVIRCESAPPAFKAKATGTRKK